MIDDAESEDAPHRATNMPVHASVRAPRLLSMGRVDDREAARQRLRDVDASIQELDWHDDLEPHLHEDLLAIVLAGEPPMADPVRHVRTLNELVRAHYLSSAGHPETSRSGTNPPPILMLTPEPLADAEAREVYAQGVALVAPLSLAVSEASVPSSDSFHGLIPRTIAAVMAGSPSESVDEALQRQARIQLALASPTYTRLSVRVEAGLAQVRGDLRVLSRRAHVERVLTSIPGIEDVVTEDVRISSRRSDDDIDERVYRLVEDTVGDAHTVTWAVDHGRVVYAGTVASKSTLDELIGATRKILGVARIENDLVIDPRGISDEARVARDIQRHLDDLGLETRVDASVVGSHAVLRGTVRDEGRRNLIRRTVERVPGVDHVVDELRAG